MTGLFTIIGASIAAMVVSVLIGLVLRLFTTNSVVHGIKTFVVTGGIGYHVAGLWTVGFFAILLAPIWMTVVGVLLALILAIPLAKQGYLGNQWKWRWELQSDDEFQAATNLLSDEEIKEAASVSASAEDFKQNALEASGIADHNAQGLD